MAMTKQEYLDALDAKGNKADNNTGGTYEGSVYYSKKLPKGKGKVKYDKKNMDILLAASASTRTPGDVGKAQKFLASIGYIDPSEIDSMYGPMTRGAINRYKLNTSGGLNVDRIFDSFKTWKDNLFDGGAEEYEEDLREGGGDMGPY